MSHIPKKREFNEFNKCNEFKDFEDIEFDQELDQIFADENFNIIDGENINKSLKNDNSENLILSGQVSNLKNNLDITKNDLSKAQTKIIQLQGQLNSQESKYKKDANAEIDRLKSLVEFQSEIIKHNSLSTIKPVYNKNSKNIDYMNTLSTTKGENKSNYQMKEEKSLFSVENYWLEDCNISTLFERENNYPENQIEEMIENFYNFSIQTNVIIVKINFNNKIVL